MIWMFECLLVCCGNVRFGCCVVSYVVICLVVLIGDVDLSMMRLFFFSIGVIDWYVILI